MGAHVTLRALASALFIVALTGAGAPGQRELGVRPTDSGGPLLPEQAAYDVTFYDLSLKVDPAAKTIAGAVTVHARIVHPTEWFVLDLDSPLSVEAVEALDGAGTSPLEFERRGDRIWVEFPTTRQPGEEVRVRVAYGGAPRVAPRPPWVGGFVWEKTRSGAPWVGVACQNDGADLWWPCKDHPSDEPDRGVALHVTVPEPLVCAANGRLEGVARNGDGTHTFNWRVSNPINNYDVSINVAPYEALEAKYTSVTGEVVPMTFWVLPEDADKGRPLLKQLEEQLRFLEERLGPYPFRADKIGLAQTSYLGMEHQTIISYGHTFQNNQAGFDWLLFHEFGHEWWGNLVTALDWRDFWLHEGFQSCMDALYVEHLKGEEAYHQHQAAIRKRIRNVQPVAPREPRTAVQVYMQAPDYVRSDGDVNGKAGLILYTLRHVIGDKAFFTALRRMAYPDPGMEKVTDGRQCRFATTDDFLHIAERASGKKLDWFFEVYLRQPQLPRLVSEATDGGVRLRWEAPGGLPFPMPVEVRVGGETRRVEMPDGSAFVPVPAGQTLVIDPKGWVLRVE